MDYLKNLRQNTQRLMVLMLLLATVLTIILTIYAGFGFWLLLDLILWLVFFMRFNFILKSYGFKYLIFIFFLILILILLFFGSIKREKSSLSSVAPSTATTKKLSADECKPFFDKYNNKVLKISGDNTIGSIGIKISPNDCQFSARYIITMNATLADNPIDSIAISSYYNYVNNLHKSSETTRGHYGVGVLSQVTQNVMTLPDPFLTSQQISEYYYVPSGNGALHTSSFYWSYERSGNFSQDKYQEMLDNNVFEIINGLPYMEKTSYGENQFSYSIDQEKAEKEGTIVKTINLTISE